LEAFLPRYELLVFCGESNVHDGGEERAYFIFRDSTPLRNSRYAVTGWIRILFDFGSAGCRFAAVAAPFGLGYRREPPARQETYSFSKPSPNSF
jgi:hypothetical protein